ncbi:U1 small nuclear ribonucleoprotein 70 kDa-like isoform X2 [Phragmites australis]|uniref:U1 small nuclear ribonucleoprotein 70 kDa-like isoform X2 n=1 Tax=Phragmites australis TaxID=29695 RepID=UPI002D76E436|nr:U1 small nuclear ribonucleoprotein 70 kDa-like isoform X2 [Phragmites australis]
MSDYGHGAPRGPNQDSRPRGQGQRPNVQQLKLMGQIHPTGLTPNLLKLFEPRPPLEYKPPLEKRKCPAYTGMAQFVSHFAEPGDPEYSPPVPKCETRSEKKARIRMNKLEQGAAKVAEEIQKYDPQSDPNATGDPYKTLFVARLNYETPEHKIKREFEAYGPIKRVRLVTDKETSKPRGYAFIEFMHTRDMKNAYKQADGRKVDGKRVVVDVERGRTVPNWHPRRLGGGLGSSRIGGENADKKDSAREQQLAVRPISEEPRRDDRRADRDREKSRESVRERDRDERTRERSHDRTRDRDSREEKHHHRDRDRPRDRERGKDRERDHGRDRDRDRRDKDRDRDRGRDYDREKDRDRSHDRHRERGKDRDKDYERASRERDRGHVHDREADYANGGPKHDKSLLHYGQDYGYSQYEQHKGHDPYGYDQDGRGHESERSKRHEREYYRVDSYGKMETNYQGQPNNAEPDGPEEGEAYEEGAYQYQQAGERMNET